MPSSPEVRRERYAASKGTANAGTKVTGTRRPRGRRKPTANQIAQNVGSILELGNAMALQMAPGYAPDALQPYEIQLLSNAAAAEILANAALLKWYQSVGSQITGPHTLAAAAIVAVVLPRLARRKMIPAHLANMATGLALGMSNIGAVESTDSVEPEPTALPGDSRPAHGGDWGDGLGEVIPSESLAGFEAAPPNRSN